MYGDGIKYFDLSCFVCKRWNRIRGLKGNDDRCVMDCMWDNRWDCCRVWGELMSIDRN